MTEINIAFVGRRIFDGITKVRAQNVVFENTRLVDDIKKVLPPCHQNWRISPELKKRDIYLGLYLQTLFLEGIGLDNGVHVSISSISAP